jgi:hypothetical protein
MRKINNYVLVYLVDGKCGPFSLQQREAHAAALHVRSAFNREDKVLTRRGRHIDEPRVSKFGQSYYVLEDVKIEAKKKLLLDVVGKVAMIDNGPILQRQLIGRTLDGLHSLRSKYTNRNHFTTTNSVHLPSLTFLPRNFNFLYRFRKINNLKLVKNLL